MIILMFNVYNTNILYKKGVRKKCQRKASKPTPQFWELQNGVFILFLKPFIFQDSN